MKRILFDSMILVADMILGTLAFPVNESRKTESRRQESGNLVQANQSVVKLKILMSTAYSGVYPIGPICTEASNFALGKLKTMSNKGLNSYELILETFDDKCDDAVAIENLMEKLNADDRQNDRLPIALLTDCRDVSQILAAGLMKPYNFIGFSSYQLDLREYVHHDKLNNFYSFGEPAGYEFAALATFMRKMEWQKVAAISEMENREGHMVDSYLLQSLDEEGIVLLSLSKIDWSWGEVVADLIFTDLKLQDPRILVLLGWFPNRMLCWLHRFGLYGPAHVVFVQNWNFIDSVAVESHGIQWCTSEMVFQVLASVIYFGDGNILKDAHSNENADITGTSSSMIRKYVQKRVDESELTPYWTYWAEPCYDRALGLLMILNQTEHILRKRNETLAQWTTDSNSFIQRGSEIVQILKEATYLTKFEGQRGTYRFTRTSGSSNGNVPVFFAQVVFNNRTQSLINIGFYNSANISYPLSLRPNSMVWRTVDQKPPRDSLLIVKIKQPPIPSTANTIFKVIAAIGIPAISGFLLLSISPRLSRRFGLFLLDRNVERFALVGDIIILAHLFLLPTESFANIGIQCTFSTAFLSLGVWMLTSTYIGLLRLPVRRALAASSKSQRKTKKPSQNTFQRRPTTCQYVECKEAAIIFEKLKEDNSASCSYFESVNSENEGQYGSDVIGNSNNSSKSSINKVRSVKFSMDAKESKIDSRKSEVKPKNPYLRMQKCGDKHPQVMLCYFFTAMETVPLTILLALCPFESVIVELGIIVQDKYQSVAFQPWRYDCAFASGFMTNPASLFLVGFIAFFETVAMGRTMFLGIMLVSESKNHPHLKAYRYTVAGVYCSALVMVAAIFIIIVGGSSSDTTLLVSVPGLSICLVTINVFSLIAPMIFKDEFQEAPSAWSQQAASTKHINTLTGGGRRLANKRP